MIPFRMITASCLLMGACNGDAQRKSTDQSEPNESAPQAIETSRRTLADFQTLRYLEGDWRGSGYQGGLFYESYRFVNDSTIEMTAWTDSTMATPREKSQYMFRDGVIRTGDGARLISVDDDGHHFKASSYSWTFRPVSADRWTAQVGPATTYTMDRVTKP